MRNVDVRVGEARLATWDDLVVGAYSKSDANTGITGTACVGELKTRVEKVQ